MYITFKAETEMRRSIFLYTFLKVCMLHIPWGRGCHMFQFVCCGVCCSTPIFYLIKNSLKYCQCISVLKQFQEQRCETVFMAWITLLTPFTSTLRYFKHCHHVNHVVTVRSCGQCHMIKTWRRHKTTIDNKAFVIELLPTAIYLPQHFFQQESIETISLFCFLLKQNIEYPFTTLNQCPQVKFHFPPSNVMLT